MSEIIFSNPFSTIGFLVSLFIFFCTVMNILYFITYGVPFIETKFTKTNINDTKPKDNL